MNKHLIERFIEGKIAINLETQQEWNEFMRWLEDNTEILWGGGDKPTEFTMWEIDKEQSTVGVVGLMYRNHASHQERKIIKYKDLKEKKG